MENNKWLREDNTVNIQVRIRARHFLSLASIYKPSFILIPFVLSKILLHYDTYKVKGR